MYKFAGRLRYSFSDEGGGNESQVDFVGDNVAELLTAMAIDATIIDEQAEPFSARVVRLTDYRRKADSPFDDGITFDYATANRAEEYINNHRRS